FVPGTRIGKYEVLANLERYDRHPSYKVRHTLLGTTLVMTALPPHVTGDVDCMARIQDAIRQASGLRHEHVVAVIDLVDDGDQYFLVAPFVDAIPFERIVRENPLTPPDALQVAAQLADALAYAHERGVVHGALNPANVLIAPGAPPRAWVAGFALGALPLEPSPGETAPFAYPAPERDRGEEVDARTDVFGLGLLIFELFESRPFLAGTAAEIETLLRDGTGPLVPRFAGMVPAGVHALVARAVRRTPGTRHQKMSYVRSE